MIVPTSSFSSAFLFLFYFFRFVTLESLWKFFLQYIASCFVTFIPHTINICLHLWYKTLPSFDEHIINLMRFFTNYDLIHNVRSSLFPLETSLTNFLDPCIFISDDKIVNEYFMTKWHCLTNFFLFTCQKT